MINLLPKLLPRTDEQREADFDRQLIRAEAKIGGKLFGPVPKGHDRQFFCLDEHTWIWHEEWTENGQIKAITTRYDVRPSGVIKSQNGQVNQRLSLTEARNLYVAIGLYYKHVSAQYERMLATA
jgi:hypothetical protein